MTALVRSPSPFITARPPHSALYLDLSLRSSVATSRGRQRRRSLGNVSEILSFVEVMSEEERNKQQQDIDYREAV